MSQENNTVQEQEISIVDLLAHYLSYWKLFAVSIVACLLIAFVYLRYATREYKVTSTIVIKDDKKGQIGADMTAFQDLGIMNTSGNLENEIEVLRSATLMRQVVDSLNLRVAYFTPGRISDTEIYKRSPILVEFDNYPQSFSFEVDKVGNNYVLNTNSEGFTATFALGDTLATPWGSLLIKKNPWGTAGFPVKVEVYSAYDMPKVTIAAMNKTSSVVSLTMQTPCPEKGKDIINSLVDFYNEQSIDEKNYVANSTNTFIENRLGIISGELKHAEGEVNEYMTSKGLTDFKAEGQLYLTASSEYNAEITKTTIQIDVLRTIKNFLTDPQNKNSIVPSNVGLTDPTILALIGKYNDEVMKSEKETLGMTEKHAVRQEYDKRLAVLRDDVIKGISIAESGLRTSIAELRKKESSYSGRAVAMSSQERESRELYRQQKIKEDIVIYLLQKKEETGISSALAEPNAKIVDRADFSPLPVSPRSSIIMLAALLLGFIIPLGYVYVLDLMDTKVRSKQQLTDVVKAPYLGEVPALKKSNDPFPVLRLRSGIAERFRIITSNIDFITSATKKDKIVAVTSTVSGEGKSFFARNLALSLATSGKKTLLVDMDLRRSQMKDIITLPSEKGLAMYLADPSVKISDIINPSAKVASLDIIPTKIYPPNPAELLSSPRLAQLFEELKGQYDYIILDMAPVGLVSDIFHVSHLTSMCVYLVRENYTEKTVLREIQDYYANNKLNNLATVLNAVDHSSKYGYRYGYGQNGSYSYGKKGNYYHDDEA